MNVLFITADQWRAECLSALDHASVKTPNLDQLAAQGVLFENHYAQATPCSPSRTSIHTGMYLHNHRVCINGTPFDARHTNWALEMKKSGLKPYLFGYTDTASNPADFDTNDPRLRHYSEPLAGIATESRYEQDMPQNWVEYLRRAGYDIPEHQWNLYGETKPGTEWEDGGEVPLPLKIESKHHETQYLVKQSKSWISQQSEPWVLHLSMIRPHPPFVAPEPYNAQHDPNNMWNSVGRSSADEEAQQHRWLAYQLASDQYRAPANPQTLKRLKSGYLGLMQEVDDNLGSLFHFIKALGQWDQTLVIFTSDHGEQLGDHWLMGKSGYFDASYHIPMIIRDPRPAADKTRGTRVSHFTENVDIMPTLLDSYDLSIPSQCDGYSLLPFLHNPQTVTNWRTEVHWEYDFREFIDNKVEAELGLSQHQCNLSVIRDHRHKYVHFTELPPLFFDLATDQNELNNLAQDPRYLDQVLHYAQKLISWKMSYQQRGLSETYLSPEGPINRYASVTNPTQPL